MDAGLLSTLWSIRLRCLEVFFQNSPQSEKQYFEDRCEKMFKFVVNKEMILQAGYNDSSKVENPHKEQPLKKVKG